MAEYDEVDVPLTRDNVKIGMKVICVNANDAFGLVKNKTYTISSVSLFGQGVVQLEGLPDSHNDWWYLFRFVLA